MEQLNNTALAMLQSITAQTQVPASKAEQGDGDSDFQKLMEKVKSGRDDGQVEERPKAEKPAAQKKENAAQKKNGEDPVEASKRLQVYLAPLTPEELAQYPASCLPTNLREGEPIVLVGVQSDGKGGQIPILVGADTAEQMYGKQVIPPELMKQYQSLDAADPEADAMLEATAPGADNSPAALLEKVTAEQFGKEIQQAAEEVQPQVQEADGDGDPMMELTDSQQAPQPLFHDVEAAPVKVGEAYDAPEAEQPDVAKQIDTGLAQALEKGESMVRIQLSPENLGSVTVEITQSAEGVIRVALSAHSGETRGLLERHAGELQGLIASRTQQSVEVGVQRQPESQQGQNQQHQNQNYDGRNGHAQDGQERRQQRHEHTSSQDFIQQLRLGLIPADGDEA